MEFFGFASGSSKTGPAFPYMPESVLNSYPSTLLEHPVMPTTAGFLNMQTPDARNLIAVAQAWADKSVAMLDRRTVQAIGIGISASICVYGAWRISQRWNENVVLYNCNRSKAFESEPNIKELILEDGRRVAGALEGDGSESGAEVTYRQLADTRAKLDELRYQLNRLEGEKDMLAAEVGMRKKIVAQLQGEINTERDKRRQAELRMEMMEWENTHLRRLRKDVAVKDGKIDELESSLKEKEVQHDKLFQENVILPKNIAAARAKEYEILHAKVQKYEMNAVMKRNSEALYKPNRHESAASTAGQTTFEESSAILETAEQRYGPFERTSSGSYIPSDWDKSASSTGSAVQPQPDPSAAVTKAKHLVYSTVNWSNCACKTRGPLTLPLDGCSRERNEGVGEQEKQKEWEQSEMRWWATELDRQGRNNQCEIRAEKRLSLGGSNATVVGRKPEDCFYELSSTTTGTDNQAGVLGHIRSFFGGSHPSRSECELTTIADTPSQMVDALPSRSLFWDETFDDKANNCCQEDEDDVDCPSISDDQSSVFMSASCGSDTSDDDTRDVSRSLTKPSNRARSTKRDQVSKNTHSPRRNVSTVNARSSKRIMSPSKSRSSTRVISPHKESQLANVSTPRRKFSCKLEAAPVKTLVAKKERSCSRDTFSDIAAFVMGPGPKIKSPHQGRARQRYRPRKSRSKLTACSNLSGSKQPPPAAAQPSLVYSLKVGNPQCESYKVAPSGQAPACATSQAVNTAGDTNKNSADGTASDSEESWIVITPAN